MKLKDKVAIVTGGSRGIGKTVADFFAREGARVIVISRDRKAGMVCDVSDRAAIDRTIRAIKKKFHRIDIVVNCAGIQAPIGPFVGNNMKDWEKNIAVNLLGSVYVTKAALPFLKRGASIINFAGGGATSSRPNFSAYAVAKTGVVKFTEVLADELQPKGIRVNAISPGAINTSMLAEVLSAGAHAGKEERAASKKRFKEGGVSPEVPAALAVFLASSDSRGLTGRLISAPWDNWRTWNKKKIEKIMASDQFTLRRKL